MNVVDQYAPSCPMCGKIGYAEPAYRLTSCWHIKLGKHPNGLRARPDDHRRRADDAHAFAVRAARRRPDRSGAGGAGSGSGVRIGAVVGDAQEVSVNRTRRCATLAGWDEFDVRGTPPPGVREPSAGLAAARESFSWARATDAPAAGPGRRSSASTAAITSTSGRRAITPRLTTSSTAATSTERRSRLETPRSSVALPGMRSR